MSLALLDAQDLWLDDPLDIGSGTPAMVDLAYADFMLATMGFPQDFIDLLIDATSIHDFTLVGIFITKPMISMIDILTPEAFTTHRNHTVRLLVLATELHPNQSLASVPVTALPSMFNPGA